MDSSNNLISYKEINKIEKYKIDSYYSSFINNSLYDLYSILGLTTLDYISAEGCYIELKNKKKILDLTAGLGVLNLGHNHPEIKKVEKYFNENNEVDIIKLGVNKHQAVLAHNLIQLLPNNLSKCFFSTSGAEAVEAAIKLAIKYHAKNKKNKIISVKNSYHGKTHGALSVTNSENYQDNFLIGIPSDYILIAEFGDIDSISKLISQNTLKNGNNDIAALIIEPIQGQVVDIPYEGYLEELQKVCKAHNILTIFDEIKVGMGRTGKLFSFMHENVIPDILTISKSLGGGKRAIGVTITSDKIFKKAYGKKSEASLHTTTFGGIGETCSVAIESLRILSDDKFLNKVDNIGKYFFEQLKELEKKHQEKIKSIKGKGLILGIEFNFPLDFKPLGDKFIKTRNQYYISSIVRELYEAHDILCTFALSSPNTLELTPPLIINKEDIDYFITSLDSCLNKGFNKLGINLAKKYSKLLVQKNN